MSTMKMINYKDSVISHNNAADVEDAVECHRALLEMEYKLIKISPVSDWMIDEKTPAAHLEEWCDGQSTVHYLVSE